MVACYPLQHAIFEDFLLSVNTANSTRNVWYCFSTFAAVCNSQGNFLNLLQEG